MSKLYTNNKTGFRGVCFETKANKYRAYINIFGERVRLGYFSNFHDAVIARVNAENLYKFDTSAYGDDSRLIRFVIKENDYLYKKAFYALIQAAFSYTGATHFATYAVSFISEFVSSSSNNYDEELFTKYNLLHFDNKNLFNDWLNGNTIKQLSKKYNITSYNVRKELNKIILLLKEEL